MTPKKRRWRWLLIGTGTLVPVLTLGTAAASLLPGGLPDGWHQGVLDDYLNPLEQLVGQWQRADPIRETIMETALGVLWEDLKGSTQTEIPDPYKVRTAEDVTGAGVLTTSPVVQQRDLGNLVDQEMARSLAAPVIGEEGNTWLEESAQRTTDLVNQSVQQTEEVVSLAESAQGMGVTQDVMKQSAQIDAEIAKLLTQQTQLTADNHTTLLQLQQLQGIVAQLAADTSEGIDESNRRERLERQVSISGSAQSPIYLPGVLGTQTSSEE